jgi:hypothetical protein
MFAAWPPHEDLLSGAHIRPAESDCGQKNYTIEADNLV